MIKLKELIELKSMVYSEEIKPKHKKKMNRATPSFHEGIVLPKIQPPDNDSKTTIGDFEQYMLRRKDLLMSTTVLNEDLWKYYRILTQKFRMLYLSIRVQKLHNIGSIVFCLSRAD